MDAEGWRRSAELAWRLHPTWGLKATVLLLSNESQPSLVTVALLSPDCWHWQPWFEIHNNGSGVVVSLCETTWVCVRPSLAFSRHPGSSLQINFQIFVPVLGTQRWKRSCTSIFFASLIVMTNRRNNQNIFHKATQSYQVINIMQPLKYKATLLCLFLKQ